jgi:hypothetical protein
LPNSTLLTNAVRTNLKTFDVGDEFRYIWSSHTKSEAENGEWFYYYIFGFDPTKDPEIQDRIGVLVTDSSLDPEGISLQSTDKVLQGILRWRDGIIHELFKQDY